MTAHQYRQYVRALARAHAQGICVVGMSTREIDGRPEYLVPSVSSPGTLHHVTEVVRGHLICDCLAGWKGIFCQHKACVVEHLLEQRAAADTVPTRERAAVAHITGALAQAS